MYNKMKHHQNTFAHYHGIENGPPSLERDGKSKNMILIYKNYNSFSLLLLWLLYLNYEVRSTKVIPQSTRCACTEHPISSIDLVIAVSGCLFVQRCDICVDALEPLWFSPSSAIVCLLQSDSHL